MISGKKIFFYFFILSAFSNLSSWDLTTSVNISNFGFSREMSESSLGLAWGSTIEIVHDLDEQFQFSGGAIVDDVTGNRIDSRLIFRSPYIIVGMGPSIASFNKNQIQLKPAVNGIVLIKKDGIFSFSTEIYSTLGNLSDRKNDYSQLQTSLRLALNIPGAICTFIIENRQFTLFSTDSSSIIAKNTDIYSLYALEADLFKKSIPFHLILTLGYKNFKRLFPVNDSSGRTMMGIGSAFAGVGTVVDIGKKMRLNVTLDSGLYNFTLNDQLAITDLPDFLFNIELSLTYRF